MNNNKNKLDQNNNQIENNISEFAEENELRESILAEIEEMNRRDRL